MTKRLFIVFAITASVAVCSLIGQFTYANDQIRISPLRTEYELARGEASSGELTIYNDSDEKTSVDLSAEAFSVINDQYDYVFDQTSGLARWVSFQQNTIELLPHDKKSIAYTIGVPIDAEPGGRYISMFATSSDNTGESSRLRIDRRIASLLYITVGGDTTRSGSIVGVSIGLFGFSANEQTSFSIKNSGTTHFRSRYSIELTSLFDETLSKRESDALILPGTVRRINESITMPFLPGIYKVEYTIGLGDTPAVYQRYVIVYIPIWSLVSIGILVLITVFILRKRKTLIRLRNGSIKN